MPPPGHTNSNSAVRPCRRTCRPCWTKCTTTPKPPLSTGSIFALSPQQIARLQPKAENGDTAAAIRLSQYYRMASGFTPEDKRLADYWDAKAAGASQAQ